jgi:hypothetical protein
MTLNKNLLDIYSTYLISSFGLTTATTLSESTGGQISHDKISRFLGGSHQLKGILEHTEYTSKDLWQLVKPTIREDETDQGIICLDDTVEEKPYTDENDVICWHFDHCSSRRVKGINMINFLYLGQKLVTPIAFEVIKKTEIFTDKEGKQKRRSKLTKNEIVRNNINQIILNNVKFKYFVMDSWFACNETLDLIHKHKKYYVVSIKTNRKIALSKTDKLKGKWSKLENLNIEADKTVEIWLEGLHHSVLLTKKVFTNQDGTTGEMYLITNDLELTNQSDKILTIYQKRWKIEEFYKSLKSNLGFSKAPTKNVFTQINHCFCAIYTYFQTEILTKSTNIKNHFQLKSQLYFKALQASMQELEVLRSQVGCER